MSIALDDHTSWPQEVYGLLTQKLSTLRAYCHLEAAGTLPWHNRHTGDREKIIARIDDLLSGKLIKAWHCTRLCDDEIESINTIGLDPLSEGLLMSRLSGLHSAGHLDDASFDLFRSHHDITASRIGQIWFVLTKDRLRGLNVSNYYNYWGGEALFKAHLNNAEIMNLLGSIGKPCIVEFQIASFDVIPDDGFGLAVVTAYEKLQGLRAETDGYEGLTRRAISAEQISRIITPNEVDFASLTKDE